MKILAVEDKEEFRLGLVKALGGEGHEVTTCSNGEEALACLEKESFQIIILDIGLPGMDGFQVLEQLRGQGLATPVIMLTGRASEESVVQGLSSGADDYISKPFSSKELLARINAAHRRAGWAAGILRAVGPVELDLEARTVSIKGTTIHLTEKEFSLLWALSRDPIRPWSREELLRHIWNIDFDPGTKVMDVHLSNLRKKLNVLGAVEIQLTPSKGYLLQVSRR